MKLGTSSSSSSEASGPPGVSGVQPGESVPGLNARPLAGLSQGSPWTRSVEGRIFLLAHREARRTGGLQQQPRAASTDAEVAQLAATAHRSNSLSGAAAN